jgi:hypothetical protein
VISVDDGLLPEIVMLLLVVGLYNGLHLLVIVGVLVYII